MVLMELHVVTGNCNAGALALILVVAAGLPAIKLSTLHNAVNSLCEQAAHSYAASA